MEECQQIESPVDQKLRMQDTIQAQSHKYFVCVCVCVCVCVYVWCLCSCPAEVADSKQICILSDMSMNRALLILVNHSYVVRCACKSRMNFILSQTSFIMITFTKKVQLL